MFFRSSTCIPPSKPTHSLGVIDDQLCGRAHSHLLVHHHPFLIALAFQLIREEADRDFFAQVGRDIEILIFICGGFGGFETAAGWGIK